MEVRELDNIEVRKVLATIGFTEEEIVKIESNEKSYRFWKQNAQKYKAERIAVIEGLFELGFTEEEIAKIESSKNAYRFWKEEVEKRRNKKEKNDTLTLGDTSLWTGNKPIRGDEDIELEEVYYDTFGEEENCFHK